LEVGAKQGTGQDPDLAERTLFLNGTIASESWFDDDVTPALFKSDLDSGKGPITVWINSPGGDVWAAAQIYNMLLSYTGKVTVKIDGLAASAASVIAMAGDEVLVSPVSMLMIHNPSTMAMGDKDDLTQAISMLDEVKNSILNAYMTKTGLSRNKLSKLMDDETWMDANKAVELGFADRVMKRPELYRSDERRTKILTRLRTRIQTMSRTTRDENPDPRILRRNRRTLTRRKRRRTRTALADTSIPAVRWNLPSRTR
jgi:ATP-dependent protease ClpP protease subunit